MSLPTTSHNRTSSVGTREYRYSQLAENGVVFLDRRQFIEESVLVRFQQVLRLWCKNLQLAIDRSVILSSEQLRVLENNFEIISYENDGYSNFDVIKKAIEIRESIWDFFDSQENAWSDPLMDVWTFFQMTTTFAYTRHSLWRHYDTAIIQLLPFRADLVRPKPDFAFGIRCEIRSSIWNMLRQWKDKSIPSVDTFVDVTLAMPFLILESEANDGTVRRAENQLANSLIQAHDILCSLDLQDALYLLGIVQVQFTVHFYMSFATRQVDEDGKAFADMIYIVKLDHCFLDNFQGCLKFLRFVEEAKSYGLGAFKDTVRSALEQHDKKHPDTL